MRKAIYLKTVGKVDWRNTVVLNVGQGAFNH